MILYDITKYIEYAYYNDNYDSNKDDMIIFNLHDNKLFVSDQIGNINYEFVISNIFIEPIIKFLLNKGLYNYCNLHGFKYTYRLFDSLDRLNDLIIKDSKEK